MDLINNSTFGDNTTNLFLESYFITIINYYYTPVLVILGTCGNMTSALVLRFTKLSCLSSSYYLTALVFADTGYLICLFIVWLELVANDVTIYNAQGVCQLVTYVTYVCSFLSIWYVVAFTVERFIAVEYPLHRPIMCTVSRAKLIIGILTFIAFGSYLYVFFVAEVEQMNDGYYLCTSKLDYLVIVNVFNSLDCLFTLVLPLIIIVVLNIKIIRRVWSLTKQPMMPSIEENHRERNSGRSNLAQLKITKMLLIVSSAVLCFNLPSYLIRILVLLPDFYKQEHGDNFYIFQQVSQLLFHTNFAINFLLYCVSGENFRQALIKLCRKKSLRKNRRRSLNTTIAETSFIHNYSSVRVRSRS